MMTKTTTHRYFKISPRGFVNEVTYFRVPADRADLIAEIDTEYGDWVDDHPGSFADWVELKRHYHHQAEDWETSEARQYALSD
jgi:hypothetical protein